MSAGGREGLRGAGVRGEGRGGGGRVKAGGGGGGGALDAVTWCLEGLMDPLEVGQAGMRGIEGPGAQERKKMERREKGRGEAGTKEIEGKARGEELGPKKLINNVK